MKYQIHFLPDPNSVLIDVDQRLVKNTALEYEDFDYDKGTRKQFKDLAVNRDALVCFCRAVSALDGMENDISISRYGILVSKASSLFKWNKLLPFVIEALKEFVADDHEMEEVAPPTHPEKEEKKDQQEQDCEV